MSFRQDYIMNQIEKLAKIIAQLAFKKVDQKQEIIINQSLAELTGLDISLFSEPKNARLLASLLAMLPDDNQKALTAWLLSKKSSAYQELSSNLMAQVNQPALSAQIKQIIN